MGCLAPLVGLTHSCTQVDGRVYIGQLGITEKELTDYMSQDDGSVGSFLADRIAQAERVMDQDLKTYFRPYIRPWTFLDEGRIGEPDDRQTLQTAVSGTRNGIVVEVCAPQSNVKLQLSSIQVWSDIGGDVVFQIHDLTDGRLLTSFTAEATVANELSLQELDIVLSIKRRKTRLLISHLLPTWYKVNTHGGGCSSCGDNLFKQGVVSAYGARIATGATKSYANIERQTHTSGISIIASLTCDHGAWLCENKELMSVPMGWKVAELCVQYGKGNADRFNNRAGNDDYLNDRIRLFNSQYRDAMEKLYSGMPLPTDPVCFSCNQTVRVSHALP